MKIKCNFCRWFENRTIDTKTDIHYIVKSGDSGVKYKKAYMCFFCFARLHKDKSNLLSDNSDKTLTL